MVIAYLLIGLFLTAVLLKFVASILPGFELEGWSPALSVAVIVAITDQILGTVIGVALAAGMTPTFESGSATGFFVGRAISVATMFFAILAVPSIRAGVIASIVAALLVSAFSAMVTLGLIFATAGNGPAQVKFAF